MMLILLAVGPGLALILYAGMEHRRIEAADAALEALRFTQILANDQTQQVESARQLLLLLSELPQLRSADSSACDTLLTGLLERLPTYSNLVLAEPDGDVVCSAVPEPQPVNLSDRGYFQEALRTKQFAISDAIVGRINGQAVITFAYPLHDEAGQLSGVVLASVELSQLSGLLEKSHLPAGSALTMIDRGGRVLARYPDSESYVGLAAADTPVVRLILEKQSEGAVEGRGPDGVDRLYAFAPLYAAGQAAPYGYVYAGMMASEVYRKANEALALNLLAIAALAVFALCAAWQGSEAMVLRQTRALLAATRQLVAGDLTARAATSSGVSELAQLARHFDRMADAVERRENQLRESEERYRWLTNNSPDVIYHIRVKPERHIEYMNPAVSRVIGYSPEEFLADPDLQRRVIHPEDLAKYDELFAERPSPDEPLRSLTLRVRHREGHFVWMEHHVKLSADAAGEATELVGAARDITERKRVEEQILALTGALEQRVAKRTAQLQAANAELQEEIARRAEVEEALRSSQQHYRALFDAADAVFLHGIDPDGSPGRFEEVNDTACRQLGYTREELLRMRPADVDALQIDDSLRQRAVSQLRATGQVTFKVVQRAKDGREIPVELSAKLFLLGERPMILSIARDISEWKQAEEEVRRLNAALEMRVEERTVELAQSYADLAHSNARLQRLNRALRTISSCNEVLVRALDEGELLQGICRTAVQVGGYRLASVGFAEDDEFQTIRQVAWASNDEAVRPATNIGWGDNELGNGPSGLAIRSGEVQVFRDVLEDPRSLPWRDRLAEQGIASQIALPLLRDGEAFGVLKICSSRKDALDPEETRLLGELAANLTYGILALRSDARRKESEVRLEESLKRLRKTMYGTVRAIAAISERRDPYTAGHQRRVSRLAAAIAQEMGLSPDNVDGIRVAAEIHDIGKISVPAEILSKPGRLTPIELQMIRVHPEEGSEILIGIEFPWPVGEMVRQHHERLDGTGYPSGIRGDTILLGARIIAVADVVEAMASHRPYRPALGLDAAMEEIRACRGSRYDSGVVDACLRALGRPGFVLE